MAPNSDMKIVTDVSRRIISGFQFGQVELKGLDDYDNQNMLIDFQNEYIVAKINSIPGETSF